MTMFGVAALIAPVVGPTLGGYLIIPVGAISCLLAYFLAEDPDYRKQERAELLRHPGLLQTQFGYDDFVSGLVMSPSGIGDDDVSRGAYAWPGIRRALVGHGGIA